MCPPVNNPQQPAEAEPLAAPGLSQVPGPSQAKRIHLADRLFLLRSRWKLLLLLTTAVFCAVVGGALVATPVYEAAATVHVDPHGGNRDGGGMYSMSWDPMIVAGTEIAVIKSRAVALRVARLPESGATVDLRERFAYRPLEVALRSLQGDWEPCELTAHAAPLPSGVGHWTLVFDDDDGGGLTVTPRGGAARRVEGLRFAEPFSDGDGDCQRCAGEPFVDRNENKTFDAAEPFTDLDQDGRWDAVEVWDDRNRNGTWDPAELFHDVNRSGGWDVGEPYQDADGDGAWSPQESYKDGNRNGEWDPAEPFLDVNGNKRYDPAESFEDKNGNGVWDAPEAFRDHDGDGAYRTGTILELDGHSVLLSLGRGHPAGRTFDLTIRSFDVAASWVQAGTTALEVTEYTGILEMGFRADSPRVSARVANALVAAYVDYKREEKVREYRSKANWLTGAVARLGAELTELENGRDDYIKRNRAVLLSERAQAMLAERGALLRERLQLDQEQRVITWMAEQLRGAPSADTVLIILGAAYVDPKTQALAATLAELETKRKLALLSGSAKVSSPQIIRLDAERSAVQEELQTRVEALRDKRLDALRAESSALAHRIEQVRKETARQDRLLQELPDKQRGVQRRSRPILVKTETYGYLVRSLREAELAGEALLPAVHPLNPAVVPKARTSPNLFRRFLAGLFLGLLVGIGGVFGVESLRRTVRSPEELEQGLGLPLLAAIPQYGTLRRRVRRTIPKDGLVTRDAPSSVLAESYRTLRASIRFGGEGTPIRTLAITSALPGEGKTITTLNLAVVMALAGSRVIVVDADLRRPRVHGYFSNASSPGLTDVIAGEVELQEAIRKTDVEGLFVLTAGASTAHPGAVIESGGFSDVLAALADQYDHVLVDGPPVLAVADPAPYLRQLDAVVLLAREGVATVDTVAGARVQVERLGGRVLGTVLNGFNARNTQWSRHGYYAYYGGYYGKYGKVRSAE